MPSQLNGGVLVYNHTGRRGRRGGRATPSKKIGRGDCSTPTISGHMQWLQVLAQGPAHLRLYVRRSYGRQVVFGGVVLLHQRRQLRTQFINKAQPGLDRGEGRQLRIAITQLAREQRAEDCKEGWPPKYERPESGTGYDEVTEVNHNT